MELCIAKRDKLNVNKQLEKTKNSLQVISIIVIVIFRYIYLTIIPRARMGSESIAHEAEGRMGY